MTYNEEDIIEEVLTENKKYFDKIYVLDGSSDQTEAILRSFDHVKLVLKDQDLRPQRKVVDGARQFLIEKAQQENPIEGWFTILHGDEIMVDNPNDIAERAEKSGAQKVNWHSLSFFLHSSQSDQVFDPKKSIQEQVVFYQPGSLEIRQFKNKPDIFYNINQRNRVFPYGIGNKILFDFPIFKHYIIRSQTQLENRPITGFAYDDLEKTKVNLPQNRDAFRDKVFENLSQVRKYEGSFEEFEPGSRPNFFMQWLAWRKYTQ